MANPIDLGLRIVQALDSIGIKGGSFLGKASNIKKAMFGGKTTMFKPNAIQSIRGEGGDFGTALKLIEDEAQFIVNASDAEKMAFLNNLNDYKELGGPVKKSTSGITTLTNDAEDLQTSIKSLQDKAKTMKDDADKGLKSAEKDLKDFLETGGQPLKAKSDKYLGGSMHEEGQLRTAIRTFLRNEYKNGKIKLDETDQFRIMEYSPMMEDDPIKVFKKIYGDEAYNKAGTFPGAFEKGENFNHYELIFKENMGEDLLKVKDKKYVGDGTLTLTKQEEVFEPTPDVDDDGIPFAEGGMADVRPGFLKGKGVTKVKQIIEYITSKFTPMDAMKEVNKVIGKQGKYKKLKLTEDDINEIVEGTNDFIFQRDPDNLFVEGSIKDKTEYFDKDDVLERDLFKQKEEPDTQVFKDSEGGIKGITIGGDDEFKKAMSEAMEEGMRESENMRRLGLDPTKMEDALKYSEMKEAGQMEKNITGLSDMSEADALRQKYPGITDDLVNKILIDDDPQRKAEVIGTLDEAFKMMEKGKGADEVLEIFKNTTRTKNSKGGRAGFMDGGASIINPESSMNNSSGLNYLLGEDDNNRVDFKNGLLVPPSKPKKSQDPMMKLMETYNTYQEALPGVSQETKKYLEQDFIKKLSDQGFSINDFMTYRMQQNYANGGRAAFGGGGLTESDYLKVKDMLEHYHKYKKSGKPRISKADFARAFFRENNADGGLAGLLGERQSYAGGSLVDKGRRGFLKFLGGTAAGVVALKTGLAKILGKDSGAVSKKVIDEVIIEGGSGAPAWLQPLINKALREGTDITKNNALKDGQVVKSLDTPTGKVDVYYDTRTGEVDIDYIGGNTALGESVNMRYTPGIADEGTKGVKPADEFEAIESIPEGQMSSPNDYNVELGENVTGDVKELYSDTSELAELSGEKLLIKDISNSIQKKKILKQMEENPDKFASDNLRDDFPDYDYGDVNPNYD